MNRWVWPMLVLLLSGAVACGDDDGSADDGSGMEGDAAPSTPSEATDAGQDAGDLVWIPMDAGQGDSPSDTPDATVPTDSGLLTRACAQPRDLLPDTILPLCSAATRDCIAGCDTEADPDACRDACIAADATAPDPTSGLSCDSCIYLTLFACIDMTDCHEGVAEFFCCLEDRCGPGSGEGCGEQLCGSELMAAITCGFYAEESCLDFLGDPIANCFAADDGDGGI